jgi:hypothetical protein
MKVYSNVIIDIESGNVLHEESHEYSGPVALAGGGSQQSAHQSYLFPELKGDIVKGARNLITGPASGDEITIDQGVGGYTVPKTLTDIMMNRAVNQVRGGYGARGLAGSGIALEGEQQAIGQLSLQGAQQEATNLTNLIAAGSGQKSSGGSSGMFGSVLCTELNRQGLMPDDMYILDSMYGLTLPADVIYGYHFWAIPVARAMRKSRVLTCILRPFILAWGKEMQARMVGGKGSAFGRILLRLGVPFCRWLGRTLINPVLVQVRF